MEKHRIRSAKAIDADQFAEPKISRDHLFVEIEKDGFVEVDSSIGPENITHDMIHRLVGTRLNGKPITYNKRAFEIGIIRDWKEEEAVS